MDYTDDIIKLFSNVMKNEIQYFKVKNHDIKNAFKNMAEAYGVDRGWMYHNFKKTDYNDPAHRCAYLHKYAMLHTSLMCNILQEAFRIYSINKNVSRKYLKLCSLGGGPGTDIVALLFLLDEIFGLVKCDVTIMDISEEWNRVFETVVSELQTGSYGMGAMVAKGFFNYHYLKVDFLGKFDNVAHGIIAEADIVTMVKFVSAAACIKTREMIQRIFHSMKSGAMVLFIDNAAGGFHEMVQKEARRCGFESVFGPLTHHKYAEPRFCRKMHGSTSQFKMKVAVEMWMKQSSSGHRVSGPQGMEVVEIDGPDIETVHLNNQKAESGWGCCKIM